MCIREMLQRGSKYAADKQSFNRKDVVNGPLLLLLVAHVCLMFIYAFPSQHQS